MIREWRKIPSALNYEVSNFGEVRSLDRYVKNSETSYRFIRGKDLTPSPSKLNYLRVNIRLTNGYKKTAYVHRLVAEAFIPEFTPDCTIDHKDRNPKNNRLDNLRICTTSENCINRPIKEIAQGKYKGIWICKRTNSWGSTIQKDRKKYFLGRYKTQEEAALAYNNKALELYGEFALLNNIGDINES